jgi:hypothetical protein
MVSVALFLGAAACAPNEEDLKRDFARIVARSNACDVDTDCVTLSPGCPLGCSVAINRKQEAAVQRAASDLVDDYERWGRACAYECIGDLEPPRCTDHKCEIPRDDPSKADAGAPQD